MNNLNIKEGRVDLLDNKIGFISSDNKFYIINFDQYKPSMLGNKFKVEVNELRKTVVRFI